MKIGKKTVPKSAISASTSKTIIVRGFDLCADLIGKLSFTEYFCLLVTGHLPSEHQRKMVDATLVAIAEHGLVPSVQASRMTLAAAPDAMQGAVAAGILGCGSVILGAAENAGYLLHKIKTLMNDRSLGQDAAAREVIHDYHQDKRAIPGYGHPLHKVRDPRTSRLISLSREIGADGPYVAIAEAIERVIPKILGKPLPLNVSGAIPAVLLDAGFPIQALKGIPILARTAGLIGHLVEELERPIGFTLSHHASLAAEYDGKAPEGFIPEK